MLDNNLLLSIFLILAFAKLLGLLVERFGIPAIVGEIFAGLALGPMALGIIHPSEPLDFLANMGIMFMMFIMGLSTDLENVIKASARTATMITVIGAAIVFVVSAGVTLLVGILLGQDFFYSLAQACLIGIGLTSTSTVIGFKYLSDLGDRFSNVFKTLLAVEVTDGVFSIMLLAIFLSVINMFTISDGKTAISEFLPMLGWSSFKLFLLIVGFIIFVMKFGGKVADILLGVSNRNKEDRAIITLSLIVLFAVAGLSDWLELTSVIGAFLAGAILAGSPYSETVIAPRIKALGYGLFIPIFFAYTGVQMNFGALLGGPNIPIAGGFGIPFYLILFIGLLIGVMGGKYLGVMAGCALSGNFRPFEAKRIGTSLLCIGEDTLVVAQIGTMVYFARDMPLVTPEIFSVLGLLIIVSSLLTPYFINKAYAEKEYRPMSPRNGNGTRSRMRSI
ncbi:cation:proton antiporter [Methanocella sp. CWC-04]|uniref:Cation:proton antiporter n=1 Tax=Methanooceanicella nereidis TaxID=2052831 RepID=A0AAP2RB49_9EURY|nr:cation:proton antiporter [Methanocella sp. CWC-04]